MCCFLPKLKECCCCCGVRWGALASLYFYLIIWSIIALAGGMRDYRYEYREFFDNVSPDLFIVLVFSVIVLAIVGVHSNRHRAMIPLLILKALLLIYILFLDLNAIYFSIISDHDYRPNVVAYVFYTVVLYYFFLLLYTQYDDMREEAKQMCLPYTAPPSLVQPTQTLVVQVPCHVVPQQQYAPMPPPPAAQNIYAQAVAPPYDSQLPSNPNYMA